MSTELDDASLTDFLSDDGMWDGLNSFDTPDDIDKVFDMWPIELPDMCSPVTNVPQDPVAAVIAAATLAAVPVTPDKVTPYVRMDYNRVLSCVYKSQRSAMETVSAHCSKQSIIHSADVGQVARWALRANNAMVTAAPRFTTLFKLYDERRPVEYKSVVMTTAELFCYTQCYAAALYYSDKAKTFISCFDTHGTEFWNCLALEVQWLLQLIDARDLLQCEQATRQKLDENEELMFDSVHNLVAQCLCLSIHPNIAIHSRVVIESRLRFHNRHHGLSTYKDAVHQLNTDLTVLQLIAMC
jgi:hypothetical protein